MNSTVKSFAQNAARVGFLTAATVMGLATNSHAASSMAPGFRVGLVGVGGAVGAGVGCFVGMWLDVMINPETEGLTKAGAIVGGLIGGLAACAL